MKTHYPKLYLVAALLCCSLAVHTAYPKAWIMVAVLLASAGIVFAAAEEAP